MEWPKKPIACAGLMLVALIVARLCCIQGWIRPVRIAGGSMAENLPGAHFQLRCTDCRFPCRYDAECPATNERVVCPNCGFVLRDLQGAVLQPGERVLIDRLAYAWGQPRRWDLIALHASGDPDYLEVKRVVGLPGERIAIRRGDVYADGRIVRKRLDQLRQLAILVHDSAFEPPNASRVPARWRAAVTPWDRLPACEPGTMPIPVSKWLVYHHWRCFASPLPRTDEYPVLDNYGYNQNESRQLHRVRDLLLVARLRLDGASGRVALRAYDGDDWLQVNLEFPAKRASLCRRGLCVCTASLPTAAYAQDVKLEFALCDRQAVLAVDQRVVICWPYDAADEADGVQAVAEELGPTVSAAARREHEDRTLAQSQPFGIAAEGLSLVIRRLQVFRDLHYLDPQGLGRDWTAPARLGRGEVLVFGDNVPISRDSRHWERPGVTGDQILGPLLPMGN